MSDASLSELAFTYIQSKKLKSPFNQLTLVLIIVVCCNSQFVFGLWWNGVI